MKRRKIFIMKLHLAAKYLANAYNSVRRQFYGPLSMHVKRCLPENPSTALCRFLVDMNVTLRKGY